MTNSIFRFDSPFRDPLKEKLFNSFKSVLERWLLFHELERVYTDARRDESASRRTMVEFLKSQTLLPQLARLVKARTPLQPLATTILASVFGGDSVGVSIKDIEEVSTLIADIEPEAKSVPVLLRHYLKLGGKLLGFNLDPNFSNALDGFILVDLTQTDRRTLERYMGKDGATSFLLHHCERSIKAG